MEQDYLKRFISRKGLESPAWESESLVTINKLKTNSLGKRVNLFGSISWKGDSIHQSLNITGKPIAKKYCEGKLKRTLKKELIELERVLCERIIHEKEFVVVDG